MLAIAATRQGRREVMQLLQSRSTSAPVVSGRRIASIPNVDSSYGSGGSERRIFIDGAGSLPPLNGDSPEIFHILDQGLERESLTAVMALERLRCG